MLYHLYVPALQIACLYVDSDILRYLWRDQCRALAWIHFPSTSPHLQKWRVLALKGPEPQLKYSACIQEACQPSGQEQRQADAGSSLANLSKENGKTEVYQGIIYQGIAESNKGPHSMHLYGLAHLDGVCTWVCANNTHTFTQVR